MDNKKILVSFLLVVLIALSVSAVSAEDAGDVIAADDVDADVIAVDDVDADVIANTITPVDQTVDAVQNAVNNASAGDVIPDNGIVSFFLREQTYQHLAGFGFLQVGVHDAVNRLLVRFSKLNI